MTNSILSALVNGALVSTLMAAAIALGLALTPRRIFPAAARYVVWWAALLSAVLLPIAYLRLPAAPRPAIAVTAATPVAAASIPAAPAPIVTPRVEAAPIPRPAPAFDFPFVLTAGTWTTWLLRAWAVSSALLLLRLLLSCVLLAWQKHTAAAPPQTMPIDLPRNARLKCSNTLATPVAAGLWRPAILIPASLFPKLSESELQQVTLHEAAHLARFDDWTLLAQRVLQALLPFHPVVRWVSRQLELEREIACDDLVIAGTGMARHYAACLTHIVELCGGVRPSWAASGVAGSRSQLARRVERLLDRNRGAQVRSGRGRIGMALCAVAAMAWLAGHAPAAIALAMPPTPPPSFDLTPLPEPIPEAAPLPAAAPTPAPDPAPQAAAATPVVVNVSVQDLGNRFLAGLAQNSFHVFEDGVEQQISDFAEKDIPLSIGIVVDNSGSMRDKQRLVDAAVAELVKSANTLDDFFVVNFNDDVKIAGPFTADPVDVEGQLHQPTRGGTALRDAIHQAEQWTKARYPNRMLVVISDGDDNSSSTSTQQLLDTVNGSAPPRIWAITLAGNPARRTSWLQQVTESTRGHEFVTDDLVEIARIAASIAREPFYMLQYHSSNTAMDGKWRDLRVKVSDQPAGNLSVTARSGYYADKRWQ